MAKSSDENLRRVYVLPSELVDRITAYQNAKGYGSEVEAVRRLLDDALRLRDTPEDIVVRFMENMRKIKDPSEVAKLVLVGHPAVSEIGFGDDEVQFWLRGFPGKSIKITAEDKVYLDYGLGSGWVEKEAGQRVDFKVRESKPAKSQREK